MKRKVELDNRCNFDKKYDRMFDKMVRDANLSPKQKYIVSQYLKTIIGENVKEVENAMDMGYAIGLIEVEHFGHNKRATKLPRLQKYVREVVNEAYGNDCIDANGRIHYDGCGIGHLEVRLSRHGVEIVDELGDCVNG